ncbi:uncharacterized protein LOC116020205 [Ipomoea triloba]|uniref:uncharacterized protein LOC116020205 n=1 Tax=Ipomoea triloba TaxID=35885 RepID=UPI00125DB121|nr:uncharacterized protein LOC116020205 [Ipomoea triloba]
MLLLGKLFLREGACESSYPDPVLATYESSLIVKTLVLKVSNCECKILQLMGSKALKATEVRYSPLEKVVYALVITARKLVPYFQGHPIRVLIDQPLAGVFMNLTFSCRLVKWAVELTQYGIEYQLRPTIKAQILADFIVECTAQEAKDNSMVIPESEGWWKMHADGEAKALRAEELRIWIDSRLVAEQVKGSYEAKGERMRQYKEVTEGLLKEFQAYEIDHVLRARKLEGKSDNEEESTQEAQLLANLIMYDVKIELSDDPVKAARIKRMTSFYVMQDGRFYKRSFGGPLLLCLFSTDAEKWVEVEPLATITEYQCRKFLWKNISCRFGIPEHLISDNGRQFDCRPFAEFCTQFGIRHTRVSVAYTQTNGQVENVNRTIVDGIRKKLSDLKGSWVSKLERVLWAYRTSSRRATGETPFSLTYGFEAKVPIELLKPSDRVMRYTNEANEESLMIEKNFLEEKREVATRCQMAKYQRSVKRYHDKCTKPHYFLEGDLVLRSRTASQPNEGGMFAKKWEGPYRIVAVVELGIYRLETMNDRQVERL